MQNKPGVPRPIGVLGGENLSLHRRVLANIDGLEVAAWAGGESEEESPESGWRTSPNPQALIDRPDLEGVVVNLPLVQRPYWAGQIERAGKSVMCPPPLPDQVDTTGQWMVLAPLLFSPLPQLIRQSHGACGPLLHYQLSLDYPLKNLESGDGDRLELLVQECLSLVNHLWGPIDSVFARGRSLALNRPQADWLVVLLRGYDGLEGQLQINALGAQARLRCALWGRQGEQVIEEDLWSVQEAGLTAQYRSWAQCLAGSTASLWAPQQVLPGQLLNQQVRQSIRQEKEIFRGDGHG
ncbi:MAG: hypothetical protein GKR89_09520 [Candidatus Latescibacteria bacterium]|nr:hypothetical protein [Candidatus Latescibacterota bacterium]